MLGCCKVMTIALNQGHVALHRTRKISRLSSTRCQDAKKCLSSLTQEEFEWHVHACFCSLFQLKYTTVLAQADANVVWCNDYCPDNHEALVYNLAASLGLAGANDTGGSSLGQLPFLALMPKTGFY